MSLLKINQRVQIPLREFRFTFSRSSGPGGQNVNKLNTKATLRWKAAAGDGLPEDVFDRLKKKYHRRFNDRGEMIVVSQRYRDQGRNVADCIEKLRDMLTEAAVVPKQRKKRKTPRSVIEKRLDEKRRRSKTIRGRGKPSADD